MAIYIHTYTYVRTNRVRNHRQVVASAAVAIAVSFEWQPQCSYAPLAHPLMPYPALTYRV